MSSAKFSTRPEVASSFLFAHAADEELKELVLNRLHGCRELYTAESGAETLELYRFKRPFMVVAAMDLGDMTGFELASRIRTINLEAQIVLVGKERDESVYRLAMEAGVVHYVVIDENADNSLRTIIDNGDTLYGLRKLQLQTAASYRLQADALQGLSLAVALLSPVGKLLNTNQAFRDMVGYSGDKDQVALAAVFDFILPAESANVWSGLLQEAAKGMEWSGNLTYRLRNGTRKFVRASLTHIQAKQNGSEQNQLLVLDDITEDEEQRSRLSVQRDSAFDLIESLQVLQNSLEAPQPLLSKSPIERSLLFPIDVQDVAQTLHECISMKDLARILASESAPVSLPFSLRTLIASVVSSFALRFKDQGKEISTITPRYLPDLFLGNQTAIFRVLSCLLANSLENCEGKQIFLKVDLKEKISSSACIQFAIEFKSSRSAANCFESMHEYLTSLNIVDDTRWPTRTGLSLAAALIDKMGGVAWIKSMSKHGCTYCFSISLPESPIADAAGIDTVYGRGTLSKQSIGNRFAFNSVPGNKNVTRPRILLADDNEVDQLTICRLLESMNFEVIRVSNGREAVEEFDASSCDAVLMDILMPEMDGFEATRMIREKERLVGGCHTPIIALTSYSLKAIHEKCVSVGMDSYLHKPVSVLDITQLFSSLQFVEPAPDGITNEQMIEQFPLIDLHGTLENLDNNIDLYREIMDLFNATIPADHKALVSAIRAGTITDILQNAHKIKGMSSNVGAKKYAELARQIQDAALQGDLGDVSQWLRSLSLELPRLQDKIAAINWRELNE